MSITGKIAAAAVAMSIVIMPTVAQAGAAGKLSLANAPQVSTARAGARTGKRQNVTGAALVLVVIAGAAGVAGAVAAADGGNSASS